MVAEKLLHHAPFVTYFGALREAYSAQFGNSDPVIIPELLAWEHKGSMLSLPRVPPEVISRLSAVTGGDIQHPCDWIKDILIGAGCLSEQVIVVDTSEHLANFVLAGDRHLQVILGDRHVLDQEKLFRALQNVGRSDEEAYARAARCLAGPTFRLPLENLITDLAESGVLCAQGTTLLSPESIRIRLAEAVVKEVKKLIMLKDT